MALQIIKHWAEELDTSLSEGINMTLGVINGEPSTEATGRQPAIRAAAVYNLMEYLDRYSFGLKRDVRAQIPSKVERIIEDASFLSWVSVVDHRTVLEAIWNVLGSEQAMDTVACCVQKFLYSPFLERLIPRDMIVTEKFFALQLGWDLLCRDICSIHVEPKGDSEIKIRLTNMNEDVFYSSEYLQLFAAIFLGVLRPEETECKIVIANWNCDLRCVDYAVSWKGSSIPGQD